LGQPLADLNPQTIRALEILEDTGLTPQLELPGVTIGVMQQLMGRL
jgi:haloalkane dehalogenase